MMSFKNLTLIGTSHISAESVAEVKRIITEKEPEIVALELDYKRFHAMMNPERKLRLADIRFLGVKGWLINLIGAWAEAKMGKLVGVKPGTEMKTAVMLAAEHKSKIALIDRDITITLKRLTKQITWKEKFRFLGDILKAVFLRKGPEVTFDIRKVPSKKVINKLMKQVKKRYPNVYNALIHERDVHMAKSLNKLIDINKNKQIVAIVGAGHEENIIKYIRKVEKSSSSQNKK
ncbi:MAG: TraB/GumN family protein [archaeon]